MNCRRSREKMPLHAGGELRGRSARLLENHMKSCPACLREMESYRTALAQARSFARDGEPLDWTEAEWRQMMARVTAVPAKKQVSRSLWLKPAFIAAAALLIAVLGTRNVVRFFLITSEITSTLSPVFTEERAIGPSISLDRASLLAVAKIAGLEDPKFPVLESAKIDVPALTMTAPETGTKIVWFINENLNLED